MLLRCLITTRSTGCKIVNDEVTEPGPNNDDIVKMILLANNRLTDNFTKDVQAMVISAVTSDLLTMTFILLLRYKFVLSKSTLSYDSDTWKEGSAGQRH